MTTFGKKLHSLRKPIPMKTIIEKTLLENFGYIWKETTALEAKLSCDLELTSEYMEVHTSRGYFSLN